MSAWGEFSQSRAFQKLAKCGSLLELEVPAPIPFFGEEVPAHPTWTLLLAPCKRHKDFRTLIDFEDYMWAVAHQWFLIPSGYVVRSRLKGEEGSSKLIYLHREVLRRKDPRDPDWEAIHIGDHINGVPFDNRRENLEWASLSENSKNAHGLKWRQRKLW